MKLTKRENEIVTLIAQKLTNKEISERLSIKPRTIDAHVHNMLSKSLCSTRQELVEKFVNSKGK